MKNLLLALALAIPASAEKPNVLFIFVDDLRPELKSLGAEYIHSPAMDSLVGSGRAFTRHYVQAPTCGASRYAVLTGRYASNKNLRDNNALMNAAKDAGEERYAMPRQFRENGYRTVSVGKVSHYPGGLGGQDWNDPGHPEMPESWDASIMPTGPWGYPQNAMHGYADGKPRKKGVTPHVEHKQGDDMKYVDGWITREALSQIDILAKDQEPFFLAVGIMKPHLPFACSKSYRDIYDGTALPPIPHPEKPIGLSTWHNSNEFRQYTGGDPWSDPAYADELRRSYAACVSYADAQIAQLLARLDETGLAKTTIVVLWGDRGWHLGEHAVWGKHTLFEEALLAPLIIRTPGMEKPGVKSAAIVESIDIYPTLCELTGVPTPAGLDGESLLENLNDPSVKGGFAVSYFEDKESIRTDQYRLTRHPGKKMELYDHKGTTGETENLAGTLPDVEEELNEMIDAAMK